MEVPKDQITSLLEHNLFGSAQMLGCFLVSSAATNAEASPYVKAENLVLLGDALYGEKEFRRALNTYKQALQYCKIIPKQSMTSSRSSLSASNRSSSPNSLNLSAINENEVKFKITLCYCALNENRPALAEMEGIPSKARTLQMNLTMGKLYRISRHFRAAISCYKDCLRHCPYVVEAIIALAELGVPAKDIISLFPQTLNRSGRPPSDHFDTGRWLQRYVEAQCCVASNDYKGGLELFYELLQRFPSNVHILLEIAKVEAIIGRSDGAIMNFEKARSIDPYIITYMDEYAMLLKTKSDHSKLNRLVHDLLNIDPARAEVLVALSVLWERKDERRALVFADKSIRIDDRHITGHIMKGYLSLSQKRPEAAVATFRAAQELRSDLRSYQVCHKFLPSQKRRDDFASSLFRNEFEASAALNKFEGITTLKRQRPKNKKAVAGVDIFKFEVPGLVRSYLGLSKTKEALYAAREAMRIMPQSAKAIKLVGDVHASNSGGREKARKFYESALRLEPGYLGAALALAELHVIEGRTGDAISLLERYLKDWADDSLHIKLAQIFAATNMLSEALSHYQSALRLNPQNEAAKKGLERLEKQMKGMDPDAPEEDDENEVEDAEGEQEEAELL